MMALLCWLRRHWVAMGLRGRLVAGYTALFAVLLVGIALGETTVVRQVLIDDRKAALPGATSDLTTVLKRPVGAAKLDARGSFPIITGGGSFPIITGDSEMVLA